MIREARGISERVVLQKKNPGKSDRDNYEHAFELLADLETLSAQPDFAIPGGVVPPNRRTGEIIPEHVMDILDDIEAEVSAIKAKLGVTKPSEFGIPKQAKVPTNVYDAITLARLMVKSLSPSS